MRKDILLHRIGHTFDRTMRSFRWILLAVVIGVAVGVCSSFFGIGLRLTEIIRTQNPWLILLLPFGGLMIVALYRLLKDSDDTGTNMVISAIHSGEKLPYQMAPLIFLTTIISHVFGASAGWEGGAFQLGGSLGNAVGHLFKLKDKDTHILIMCGMSAAMSALFRTPLSAAILPIEMISVGVMHYSALVPCVISALVADGIAGIFGLYSETFLLISNPVFRIRPALITGLLACLCAFLSILFCVCLHAAERLYKRYLKNSYLRIFIGGCLFSAATCLIGSLQYSGTGMNLISMCFHAKDVVPYAFLLKMLLTALAIGCGFKGGEVIPALCVGACFGYLIGNLIGFSPALCAAIGIVSLFCGVTNCPIAALLFGFELFGYQSMPYLLLATAISYMFSGYFGLFQTQRIVYSKYKTNYINKTTD